VAEAAADPYPPSGDLPLTVVRPRGHPLRIELGELWRYRELAYFLVWRDVKVRYKQTAVGVAWAVLQPLLTMLIFTFIFGRFANFPSQGLPYPVFVFSGLLPWTYFSSALSQISMSVVQSTSLVTKVWFPRLLLPFAAAGAPAFDLLIASSVLIGLMAFYSLAPAATVPLVLITLVLTFLTALGFGLFLAAINVRYRDVPHALPFMIQIWLYLTPVIYPVEALPERWQWVLSLNPMTAVIGGFRWALIGTPFPSAGQLAVSLGVASIVLVAGLAFFNRSERSFADVI
jgi:lipopolysaccharide transport system permease protein